MCRTAADLKHRQKIDFVYLLICCLVPGKVGVNDGVDDHDEDDDDDDEGVEQPVVDHLVVGRLGDQSEVSNTSIDQLEDSITLGTILTIEAWTVATTIMIVMEIIIRS